MTPCKLDSNPNPTNEEMMDDMAEYGNTTYISSQRLVTVIERASRQAGLVIRPGHLQDVRMAAINDALRALRLAPDTATKEMLVEKINALRKEEVL